MADGHTSGATYQQQLDRVFILILDGIVWAEVEQQAQWGVRVERKSESEREREE